MRMEDVRGIYDGSYFYKVGGVRRAKYIQGRGYQQMVSSLSS